jgi:hypothetical protein
MSQAQKKKLKLGGCFVTDENFKTILFTKQEALQRSKKYKKKNEKGCTFTNFHLIERDTYFALSLS